jgi:NAD(P)-dependent dehydrogenase (short-subunit alcohol dehydrogenase family)
MMDLKGRKAFITGATGHVGRVISETLAEMGADLILVDRPSSRFKFLQRRLEKKYRINSISFFCDLESEIQRIELIKNVKRNVDRLNILVNNAAFVGDSSIRGWSTSFSKQSISTWRRAIEVNLTAGFHFCQGLAPLLQKAKGANILNIGSIYGEMGPDWRLYNGSKMGNPAAYAVSKSGLIQLTRWLSTTLAPKIRVNCISPGGISRNQLVKFRKRYISRTPLQRMGELEDLIGATTFLTSDLARYVTGINLKIDGGWGVW